MMGREWSPGDVAMVKWGGGTEIALRAEQGWSFADMHQWLGDANPHDARPLVVIDAEDREQVERLAMAYIDARENTKFLKVSDLLQVALREFANPTPPKPDEPTGLGAVVEDDEGNRWVRAFSLRRAWTDTLLPQARRKWSDIDAVRVLSEGVTP